MKWITITDTSEKYNISKGTLQNKYSKGVIKGKKKNGRVFLKIKSIEKFLKKYTHKSGRIYYPAPDPSMKHLRASDVTGLSQIGKSTVWLHVKQGKITAHKLSDRVTIFKREEVEKLIK